MSYRIRGRLWALLTERERTASWLARQSGYTPQYIRMLRAGLRATVSDAFAHRVAAALAMPIDDLFERVDAPPRRT